MKIFTIMTKWRLQKLFLGWLLRNLNYTKFNKKKTSYKKKKKTCKYEIHKVLQFSFMNFFFLNLKLLHDSLIIKMLQAIYLSNFFVKKKFSWTFSFFM